MASTLPLSRAVDPGAGITASALSPERIHVVDALRGWALAGILLLHHIERFNFFQEPTLNPGWAASFDGTVWQSLFFLFGGKSYAVFSMLFGFSFWIMYSKRRERGEPFAGRFLWRLALLAGFGLVHSLYYSGDLLLYYALWGILVVLVRNWSDRALFLTSVLLFLHPQYLWRAFRLFFDEGYVLPADRSWHFLQQIFPHAADGTFLEWVQANVASGWFAHFSWMWSYGRMCHIPALFLLGMLACRREVFTAWPARRWILLAAGAFAVWLPLFGTRSVLLPAVADEALRRTLFSLFDIYASLALAAIGVSFFVLLWRTAPWRRLLSVLAPYGRMSLTNYMAGSLGGAFIYYNWGLRLHPYSGATVSLLIGLGVLALHLAASHWWLGRFGQGPLEFLWRRLTWIGAGRKAPGDPGLRPKQP